MRKLTRFVVAASAAALTFVPAGVALAQDKAGGGTTTTADPPAAAPETTPEKGNAAPKKKKPARMTRQQEIDRSIDRGTVPARYRSSVPKQYHQYIPFDKR
ncbi:hypothetical protein [Bradyrhizobium archetypum]|uniref:Uncharacterized protein n=1 Tax=Bradyrhizobium archetypum TaxID=2721160 RepID=A0A7Y4M2Z6_9BRAD|nr:hypothetical protein [Bradyrhizobium archetypum]NOJ47941.1 hypothetical protein [Bradyrhizobium archetypum]